MDLFKMKMDEQLYGRSFSRDKANEYEKGKLEIVNKIEMKELHLEMLGLLLVISECKYLSEEGKIPWIFLMSENEEPKYFI